jgi:hypothetical protein
MDSYAQQREKMMDVAYHFEYFINNSEVRAYETG